MKTKIQKFIGSGLNHMGKKQIILSGFLAMAGVANAQTWSGSGSSSGNTYRSGNVGIGNVTSPSDLLHVTSGGGNAGVLVENNSTYAAMLTFKTQASGGNPGCNFILAGTGGSNNSGLPGAGSGNLDLYDVNGNGGAGKHVMFITKSTDRIGFGTTSPGNAMELVGSGTNHDGMIITNSNYDAALTLNSTGSSRTAWVMRSGTLGSLTFENQGAGFTAMNIKSNGNCEVGASVPYSSKFSINNPSSSGNQNALYCISEQNTDAIGLRAEAYAYTNGSGIARGIKSYGLKGQTNYGGWFQAKGAGAGITSYGVYAEIDTPWSGGTNYALFGSVAGTNNGSGPYWAGYFNGDVFTTAATYYTSDKNLKKDISKIKNSLDIIKLLNPVTYNYDIEANPSVVLPSQIQYGFISQEVEKIIPDFTKTTIHPAKLDENGKEIYPAKEILGLNYNGFIAILTKGIQEQQAQIEDLKNRLSFAENQLSNSTRIDQINSDNNGFAIDQNIPNPFSHETVINYSLPQKINNASLIVYDLSGKQLISFPLDLNGKSISINSDKLAAGIYIYSVMADGKIMDSKRMVVSDKQ